MIVINLNFTPSFNLTKQLLDLPAGEVIIWYVISTAARVFGLFALGLLIVALLGCFNRSTRAEWLILQQIVLEFVEVFCFGLYADGQLATHFDFHVDLGCRSLAIIVSAATRVERWLGVSIALNRFVALLCPHSYAAWSRPSILVMSSVLTYAIASISPILMVLQGDIYSLPSGECAMRPLSNLHTAVATVLGFPEVAAMVIYLVVLIVHRVRRFQLARVIGTRSGPAPRPPDQLERQRERRYRLTRTLFFSTLLLSTWLIVHNMVSMHFIHRRKVVTDRRWNLWNHTMYFMCKCATPVLFFAMNREYRQSIKKIVDALRNFFERGK